MIFDVCGPEHEAIVNQHPLFLPQVWQTVLSCFVEMEAINLDCIYGCPQIGWLIEKRMSAIPSSQSWLLATYTRSLGMMIYLLRFGISCPDIEDIIQYAINKNYMETLVFFTHPEFKFYDNAGVPLKMNLSLQLDKAICKNYLNIVTYCLWRFPRQKEKMLKKALPTLSYIMSRNLLPMLKLIVPSITKIPNFSGIRAAACLGYKSLVEFALQHINTSYTQSDIPNDLLVSVAKKGHLNVLTLLMEYRKGFIPLEAYQKAFAHGHVEMCRYIQKKFPTYQPSEKDIIEACTYGHHKVIELLPDTTFIPKICFDRAARCDNPMLLNVLHRKRPDYKFPSRLLTAALHSNNSQVFLTVFLHIKQIPPGMEIELVTRRMRRALLMLHRVGQTVYTPDGFLAAARNCDLEILQDILEVGKVQISNKIVEEALSLIYVSSETLTKRGEAYTYLDQRFQHLSKRTMPSFPTLGQKRTFSSVDAVLPTHL
jgi:hypothetical protein